MMPSAKTSTRANIEKLNSMERETGVEPATSTLARSHSTTELLPLGTVQTNYSQKTALGAKCLSEFSFTRESSLRGCSLPRQTFPSQEIAAIGVPSPVHRRRVIRLEIKQAIVCRPQ